jgi:O-antigen/teichoic acid export membrane protein
MGTGKYIKQLAGESVVYGISGTISRFIGFFLMPIYTRVFMPAEYGIIALVDTATTLMSIFVVLGLDHSSARWFYDTKDATHRRCTISSWFWCQLTMSTLAGTILLVFARPVSLVLLQSEEYASLIRFAALSVPMSTFAKVIGNWLRYQRRAWTATIFFTASSLATVACTILFVVLFRWGLSGVFSARLVAAAVTAGIAVLLIRGWITPAYFSMAYLKPMLLFGLPYVPASVAYWVKVSSGRLILNLFCGKAEVGLYAIATSLASPVGLFTSAFQLAWAPFAYSILHEKRSRDVYAKVLDIYAFCATVLCTAVSLFSVPLLSILTTRDYYSASSCVPFLAYAFVFNGALYVANLGSGITKKSMPAATGMFIEAIAALSLSFMLVPRMGKEGAAAAIAISSLLNIVYLFHASQKNCFIPYRFRPALTLLGFSWLLIAADYWWISGSSLLTYLIRGTLLFLFLPLGILLGVVPWKTLVSAIGKAFLSRHGGEVAAQESK